MRRFIVRTFLFFFAFITFGHSIKAFLPYYWGNPWWRDKAPYLHASRPTPNVFFVGSSRTHRHIVPNIFDSLLNAHNIPSRSFNLGSPGMFTPQTHFLLEQAIRSGDIPKGSLVVLEYGTPLSLPDDQLTTAKGNFWLTPRNIVRLWDYDRTCTVAETEGEIGFIDNYALAFLQNVVHYGQFKGIIHDHRVTYLTGHGVNNSGFMSFNEEILAFPSMRSYHQGRHDAMMADTMWLSELASRNIATRRNEQGEKCSWMLKECADLQEMCEANQIELIHYLPPKPLDPTEWVTFRSLPPDRSIDCSDPSVHPEFFYVDHRHDNGHLNEKGAVLFTRLLAERLLELEKHRNLH